VSRKVKGDWDVWNARSLAEEPICRLILDGTVVRVRLDRKATSIVLLVVLGVREDGQKVLLAVKNMGGETSEAWRAVLDDLVKRWYRQDRRQRSANRLAWFAAGKPAAPCSSTPWSCPPRCRALARGTAISTRPKVPNSDRDR
jgi:mutator family transposase